MQGNVLICEETMQTIPRDCHLLDPPVSRPADAVCNPEVLVDLAEMAFSDNAANLLAVRLNTMLGAQLGRPAAVPVLVGLQELILRGEAAGARLAAAFLDVTTPGARLIPMVQSFSSSRRLRYQLTADGRPMNPFQSQWMRRLGRASTECGDLLAVLGVEPRVNEGRPGHEKPWPALRRCFLTFLEDVVAGRQLMPEARNLMADLIRLETDAWQERSSNLAGSIDPYRTQAVQRVLPILSSTDSQVQDLRQLISWIENGNDQAAFTNQVSSAIEVLDERDHRRLRELISGTPALAPLAALSEGVHRRPLEGARLARGVAALLALGGQLKLAGLREEDPLLYQAIRLVQDHLDGNTLRLELPDELARQVAEILKNPVRGEGLSLWPLTGLRVAAGSLVLDLGKAAGVESWENFLPHPSCRHPLAVMPADAAGQEAEQEEDGQKDPDSLTAAAIKHLVMSNIMSTSVTLGFLRNPKVIAIPGLVADVAARTRNPQIIETIATDRALFTGFANRDVPRVCLRSPCNASIKVLRKFVHVKYVNKVDLKRMAEDRAGMRREVINEIKKYLETLA
jgi:hypothetical protein